MAQKVRLIIKLYILKIKQFEIKKLYSKVKYKCIIFSINKLYFKPYKFRI